MRRLSVVLVMGVGALLLSSCTLISPNAAPQHIAKSQVGFGLLDKTIPKTGGAKVRFITQPVYIVDATNHLSPSSRIVPSPPSLATVIAQLLIGPTAIEKSAGYTSALPANLVMVSAAVRAGVGYLNFATPLDTLSRSNQLLAVGQLVLTAHEVGATNGIVINVAGVSQHLLMPNGQRATLVTSKNFQVLLNA